jgi:hypothetical protein
MIVFLPGVDGLISSLKENPQRALKINEKSQVDPRKSVCGGMKFVSIGFFLYYF